MPGSLRYEAAEARTTSRPPAQPYPKARLLVKQGRLGTKTGIPVSWDGRSLGHSTVCPHAHR